MKCLLINKTDESSSEPYLQSQMVGVSTGHEGSSGRGTTRLNVGLVEYHPLPRHAVQGGRVETRVVPTDIGPPEIVRQDHHNVRRGSEGSTCG